MKYAALLTNLSEDVDAWEKMSPDEAQAARAQYEQQSQAAEAALQLARTTHERMRALRTAATCSRMFFGHAALPVGAGPAADSASSAGPRSASTWLGAAVAAVAPGFW